MDANPTKKSIKTKPVKTKMFSSFQHVGVQLPHTNNNNKLIVVCIYRLLYVHVITFLQEFAEFLEIISISSNNLIIAGDINIHMETQEMPSIELTKLLDMFNLKQHVSKPTHIHGHTIDAVITRLDDPNYIENMMIEHLLGIHHFKISFCYTFAPKQLELKTITYRKIDKIDNNKFREDLSSVLPSVSDANTTGNAIQKYNTHLNKLVDKHAPKKTAEIRIVKSSPWFDEEYAKLRKERRKAEKKYKRSKSESDKKAYILLQKQTTEMAKAKKKSYITDKLDKNSSLKDMYSIVKSLLDKQKMTILPDSKSPKELAEDFKAFFSDKIRNIRDSLNQANCDQNSSSPLPPNITPLDQFKPATLEELKTIISSSGIKSAPHDPLPTSLMRKNQDLLLPYWLEIVNLSLRSGCMDEMKTAIIIPLIKDLSPLIDRDEYKNYRPVSNLLFISKLVERVVDARLDEHMTFNNLHSRNQFGYKKQHSTELLLLKIFDKLLINCDKGMASVVLLLDFSAAFDTVDHDKLLNTLQKSIGITGIALKWFRSFLVGRSYQVKIGDCLSEAMDLDCGVAQGSVLGPRLFNIYIEPLYKEIKPLNFDIEGFADDHQPLKPSFLACKDTF